MREDNKRLNISDELARADDCLQAAEAMSERGIASVAMTQAYYYAFKHARALLLSIGLEARTHSGVISMVGLHFAKTGRLAPKTAHTLNEMEAGRLAADYDTRSVLTPEMGREAVQRAKEYAQAARAILEADGYL